MFDKKKFLLNPNPTYEEMLEAVREDGGLLKVIKDAPYEIQLAAVEQNGYSLKYVTKKTDEIIEAALNVSGLALDYVPKTKRTRVMELKAVIDYCCVMEHIDNPTYEMMEIAARGYSGIEFIKDAPYEIEKIAIENSARNIQYVKKQTKELIDLAVENDYSFGILKYIKDPTYKQVEAACIANPDNLKYVDSHTDYSVSEDLLITILGGNRIFDLLILLKCNPEFSSLIGKQFKKHILMNYVTKYGYFQFDIAENYFNDFTLEEQLEIVRKTEKFTMILYNFDLKSISEEARMLFIKENANIISYFDDDLITEDVKLELIDQFINGNKNGFEINPNVVINKLSTDDLEMLK